MFSKNSVAALAQEAKDLASRVATEHGSHVAVCLDNQRRIETRFSGIEGKLDRQNDEFRLFKDNQLARLDAIKEADARRYIAMMRLAFTMVFGIFATFVTVSVQIAFHLWK